MTRWKFNSIQHVDLFKTMDLYYRDDWRTESLAFCDVVDCLDGRNCILEAFYDFKRKDLSIRMLIDHD